MTGRMTMSEKTGIWNDLITQIQRFSILLHLAMICHVCPTLAQENCTLHYTLLVDNSGSMTPSWSQLTKAVQGFKDELAQNSRVANSTKARDHALA